MWRDTPEIEPLGLERIKELKEEETARVLRGLGSSVVGGPEVDGLWWADVREFTRRMEVGRN